ncbi:MAG TPA: RES family NAD+ phosphorylase [Opitutaceae bacterium]
MPTPADPGAGNLPPTSLPERVPVAKIVPAEWWHNAHAKAPDPLEFSGAHGRFSGPELPRKVVYLAADSVGCFWECGLGRDLIKRFFSDRSLRRIQLEEQLEYTVRLDAGSLRLFDARDLAARRLVGAHTVTCFCGEHAIARAWARVLMEPALKLDGILYESTRQSPTLCLALFDTSAGAGAMMQKPELVRTAWDDPLLLTSLIAEGVSILNP